MYYKDIIIKLFLNILIYYTVLVQINQSENVIYNEYAFKLKDLIAFH